MDAERKLICRSDSGFEVSQRDFTFWLGEEKKEDKEKQSKAAQGRLRLEVVGHERERRGRGNGVQPLGIQGRPGHTALGHGDLRVPARVLKRECSGRPPPPPQHTPRQHRLRARCALRWRAAADCPRGDTALIGARSRFLRFLALALPFRRSRSS